MTMRIDGTGVSRPLRLARRERPQWHGQLVDCAATSSLSRGLSQHFVVYRQGTDYVSGAVIDVTDQCELLLGGFSGLIIGSVAFFAGLPFLRMLSLAVDCTC